MDFVGVFCAVQICDGAGVAKAPVIAAGGKLHHFDGAHEDFTAIIIAEPPPYGSSLYADAEA